MFFHNTESFVLACVVKRGRFFCCFFPFLCCKTDKKSKKNAKKCKKMQKNYKKICIYQKKVVPLHRQMKKTPISNPKSNPKI